MPQKKGDWLSQFEDVQATPLAPAPAERQAAPPAEDWLSQFDDVPQEPTYRTSNEKDVYGSAVVRGPMDAAGAFVGELHTLNPAKWNESIQQAFWHPVETIGGMLSAHDALRVKGQEAFKQGDYLTGMRHFQEWLIPIATGVAGGAAGLAAGIPAGPVGMYTGALAGASGGYAGGAALTARMSNAGDLMQEGEYARGLGAATDAGLQIAVPVGLSNVGRVGVGMRGRVPVDPREAAAVAFAREQGIPLDMATATGSTFARNLQKRVANSYGGEATTQAVQRAQSEALASAGARLADEANPGGGPIGPIQAAENIEAAYVRGIERQAARARGEYSKVEAAERAAPEEWVEGRQPKAADLPVEQVERNFLVRWLADDLREAQFQQGGSTKASRDLAYAEATAADAAGKHGFVTNAHVAGTPVQRMLDAAGVKGTRSQQAATLENYLSGRTQSKTNGRLDAVADVMREAWDGERFDWDLVSDAAIARTGVRRRDFQAPSTWDPEMLRDPGASRFFPSEAAEPVAKAPVLEAQQLATDIGPSIDAMRGPYERLKQDNAVVPLMGSKAEALRVLERFVNGPRSVPLSVAENALGELKSIARTKDIAALMTEGQGIAAQAVKSLSAQVRKRAAEAGPEVLEALEQGRAATREKYDLADVRETITGAPEKPVDFRQRAVFEGLTAPKDAGIAKLRELRRTAPEQVPDVARAKLEDILGKPTSEGGFKYADKAAADWQKVGPETRHILYKPEHLKALDEFFTLAKKIGENPNPSGTAGTLTATNLIAGGIPMWVTAKILYSPRAIAFMNRGLRMSVNATPAARTAAAGQFAQALREAGVSLEQLAPAAAEDTSPQGRRP